MPIVKTDSKASIKFTGLMGQNFVAIDFGSPGAPKAEDGAVLATVEQPDLSAIMTKLDGAADGIQNMTKTFLRRQHRQFARPARRIFSRAKQRAHHRDDCQHHKHHRPDCRRARARSAN